MAAQFARPTYHGRSNGPSHTAPNAALLIDFDNVTMGIRSDLSKELKSLLNSDIIKGKVAVQRAYADWRRYPQYIVPLSEASVDLIFAPAYGSAKKNATDIRLAIDALELVFTRPEIGTFILLSGDSDFSSLVLKLKEYGKYVIGVGIRESASDLLVQNCDEYYSYSVLSGLTKESDEERQRQDPWDLVERAVRHMAARRDVMRSDRLKQVMLELDSTFNEKELGYSKFSRFLSDAVNRDRIVVKKGGAGQWEVFPPEADGAQAPAAEAPKPEARPAREETRGRRGGRDRDRERGPAQRQQRDQREERAAATRERQETETAERTPAQERTATPERQSPERTPAEAVEVRRQPVPDEVVAEVVGEPRGDLRAAYDLLRRAVDNLVKRNGEAARDSDVKRQMLELVPGWDEATLGFSKFSRFLRQAHDAEIIDLHRIDGGNYQVTIGSGRGRKPAESARSTRRDQGRTAAPAAAPETSAEVTPEAKKAAPEPKQAPEQKQETAAPRRGTPAAKQDTPAERAVPAARASAKAETPEEAATETAPESRAPRQPAQPAASAATPRGIGARLGTRGRPTLEGPPPLLPGQAIVVGEAPQEARPSSDAAAEAVAPAVEERAPITPATASASELGLPTDEAGIRSYILGRYKGVGIKTVEALLEEFGAEDLFNSLDEHPDRVQKALGGSRRADLVLAAWKADREQREAMSVVSTGAAESAPERKAARPAARRSAAKPAAKRSSSRPAAKARSKAAPKSAETKSGDAAEEKAATGAGGARRRRGGARKPRAKVESGAGTGD